MGNTFNHFFIDAGFKAKRICMYCYSLDHIMKDCPEYRIDTDGCSNDDYFINHNFDKKVRKNDLKGFRSAGIFPYTINKDGSIHVLMVFEKRGEKSRYNFIGGKRESKEETPLKTMERELKEEHNGEFKIDTTTVVTGTYWIAKSKYFLFCARTQQKYDVETNDDDDPHLCGWIPIGCLSNNLIVHQWCIDIIKSLNLDSTDCCIY